MPSSSSNTNELIVMAKRLDLGLVNRNSEYPQLPPGTKVLVVPGCIPVGAVTQATVARLVDAGCNVRVFGGSPGITKSIYANECKGKEGAFEVLHGNVVDKAKCAKAVLGQEVILYIGADIWEAEYTDAATRMLEGTRNMLDASQDAAVKCFVFASSANTVFGGEDLKASSADVPYPAKHLDPWSAALAEAEQAVASANGSSGNSAAGGNMLTCNVRAAAVYGPGENEYLLPELVFRARNRGVTCPIIVGDGNNVVDFVYAGNVAHALVLAVQRQLASRAASADASTSTAAAGDAFFVTDGEPVPFGDFTGRVLSGLGYPAPGAGTPLAMAAILAVLIRLWEVIVILFLPQKKAMDFKPSVTTRRIAEEGKTRCFDISRARKELGYAPLWTQEEGLSITLQASESLRNPQAKVKHVGPFTMQDVARHSGEDDAWIVVDGKVYDVTPYLDQHPGGDSMLRNAGGDASEGFHGPQHPAQAKEILDRHYVGDLLKSES